MKVPSYPKAFSSFGQILILWYLLAPGLGFPSQLCSLFPTSMLRQLASKKVCICLARKSRAILGITVRAGLRCVEWHAVSKGLLGVGQGSLLFLVQSKVVRNCTSLGIWISVLSMWSIFRWSESGCNILRLSLKEYSQGKYIMNPFVAIRTLLDSY